jgi:hypothetical protein
MVKQGEVFFQVIGEAAASSAVAATPSNKVK